MCCSKRREKLDCLLLLIPVNPAQTTLLFTGKPGSAKDKGDHSLNITGSSSTFAPFIELPLPSMKVELLPELNDFFKIFYFARIYSTKSSIKKMCVGLLSSF